MSTNTDRIRPAEIADLPEIKRIESTSATAAHWTAAEYVRLFETGNSQRTALVAEDRGRIRGFIVARCVAGDWEIENVVVDPALRRRGIGRELLQTLLQLAASQAPSRIFLEVRESNQPARNLYSQLGFSETGRRRAYYSHPIEDAVTYEIVIEI